MVSGCHVWSLLEKFDVLGYSSCSILEAHFFPIEAASRKASPALARCPGRRECKEASKVLGIHLCFVRIVFLLEAKTLLRFCRSS